MRKRHFNVFKTFIYVLIFINRNNDNVLIAFAIIKDNY